MDSEHLNAGGGAGVHDPEQPSRNRATASAPAALVKSRACGGASIASPHDRCMDGHRRWWDWPVWPAVAVLAVTSIVGRIGARDKVTTSRPRPADPTPTNQGPRPVDPARRRRDIFRSDPVNLVDPRVTKAATTAATPGAARTARFATLPREPHFRPEHNVRAGSELSPIRRTSGSTQLRIGPPATTLDRHSFSGDATRGASSVDWPLA